jgi:large subunit ribosomal protein L16
MRGAATRGNYVAFGEFGLQALEPGWISNRSIEAARIAITRHIKRHGKVWIRIFPNKSVTKKPLGDTSKGNPEGWVAVVRPGRVMFELEGVEPDVAKQALQLAAAKLPVKCKIIGRERRELGDAELSTVQEAEMLQAAAPRAEQIVASALAGSEERRPERKVFTESPAQLATMADYHRARRGFPNDAELAEVLGVHRSRLAAWKDGLVVPTTVNARLLSHLAVTVGELEEFLDRDVIPDWFASEQHTLDGRTPAEALREGHLAEVLFAANATEHGAYI